MGLPFQKNIETTDVRPDISIGHLGLRVSHFKASFEFFKLVGARVVAQMPSMAILELRGGTHIILRGDNNAKPTHAGFDLMVDDIQDMRERLILAGYNPSKITRGGVHKSFAVTDPSGIILEFTSSHATGPV